MKLNHGLHLAYCTNIHRGENWAETFHALQTHTLAVRQRVCPNQPYAIGLRLSNLAAHELSAPAELLTFQRWLEQNNCYVFTINGFPFGRFHGGRVKEQVYLPDWTSPERLEYTNLLFDLLVKIAPADVAGSVSTLPGSFKEFIHSDQQTQAIRDNLWRCVEHITRVSEKAGRDFHLGLEPEPLGYFETSQETITFFASLQAEHPNDSRLATHLGVNYDTCHLAIEFEEPQEAIAAFQKNGIKISKLHLSSALKLHPTEEARKALAAFADDIYLHQVVVKTAEGRRLIYKDLTPALNSTEAIGNPEATEWRVHFHLPLHNPGASWYRSTSDHVLGVLDLLRANPALCSHLEMETYTWEVLPSEIKNRTVVDQLVSEYEWTLARMAERSLV